MSLIDEIMLTDEEMATEFMKLFSYSPSSVVCRVVYEAATAKALAAILEWLRDRREEDEGMNIRSLILLFEDVIVRAGIEQPKEADITEEYRRTHSAHPDVAPAHIIFSLDVSLE